MKAESGESQKDYQFVNSGEEEEEIVEEVVEEIIIEEKVENLPYGYHHNLHTQATDIETNFNRKAHSMNQPQSMAPQGQPPMYYP